MGHGAVFSLEGANLSRRGQDARLRLAAAGLTVALGLTIALIQLEIPRAWRLLTFIPFLLSAMGIMQGLLRVCPMNSQQGRRETATGATVPITDEKSCVASRRAGAQVFFGSLLMSSLATAAVLALP